MQDRIASIVLSRGPVVITCRWLFPVLPLTLAALLIPPSSAATPATPTANTLFAHAKAEAQRTHRNILVVFSASWCPPCKFYEQFLQDPQMKRINRKVFVVLRITVGEFETKLIPLNNPDGAELRSFLGAVSNPGVPFLVITTPGGVPIVNSYLNGDTHRNAGGPFDGPGLDWYMEMLKRAAPSLSDADRAAIRNWVRARSPATKSEVPITPLQVP